ncbi:type IA DNA topoisomerase [Desulforhabdus amnigena]|uniref:DNA topoisomerase n=1 Tax=Desulforhabdus amnigena TaxID=40218 RepID=A0A9W6D1V7_9BACT|nr:type IA DNA topoisomerase [Desulforhabdus amnigena]GLI34335.1 DNA topoisomerase [Desulforhabdus amnigena]
MVTLVLTEKPSVARDFARALEVTGKKDGFIEGNGYVITWAVGHLVELAEPEDYDDKWKKWKLESLPILPESLKYKPISNAEKQLGIIQRQLRRADVGRIVIATDAGREGEVIARTILGTVADVKGELYRFWTSQALTTQVVRETLKDLKPASNYDRLWNAGQARQIADWLVGMNFSRSATLKLRGGGREIFSVGRVQTAVLALLVDRKRERENFVPQPYWLLRVNFSNARGSWWGSWFRGEQDRFHQKESAEEILALVEGQTGKVKSVKREKKKLAPPLLYSLTDLQREANSKFGLSAQQTLDIAQKLYEEKKCLSYPRTDSKVLGTQNVDLARKIVSKLSDRYPELFQGVLRSRIAISNKRVFNDARLTDHHALIPLAPLPSTVTHDQSRIYDLVLKRFAAAFHPDYEYEATLIVTEVTGETFRTKGSRPLALGWKTVYGTKEAQTPKGGDDEPEEENLPPLERGDAAKVEDSKLEERMTQPPPEYTEALLLKDMTNPSRYVSEEELQKIFKGEVGLGTQATRAQIIETLLLRQYVVREKKKLAPTDKGCFLIDRLRRFEKAKAIATPEETARWEMELEKIALGVGDPDAFMRGIREFVENGVEEFKMSEGGQGMRATLGKCPACGGEIIEGKKGFGCSNWREKDGGCRFVVWKEIEGQKIWPGTLRVLLSGRATQPMRFRSEEGGEFTAALKLERDEREGGWVTRFVSVGEKENGSDAFPSPAEVLGQCPRCGGNVVEGNKGYGCVNWRESDGGCRFVIWKVIAGRELPMDAVRDLLLKGETETIHGFISRKGKEFSAKLKLDESEFKTIFVFENTRS